MHLKHEMAADVEGKTQSALVNNRIGLGFSIETNKSEFPAQFEWQNFQSGLYALGIEPSTHHVLGKEFARERNELIWLEHNDERNYHTIFRIHEGSDEIASLRTRIQAIAIQSSDPYPQPSGNYMELKHE